MPKDLLLILKKRPLIMDGAMGTILMSKGIAPGENFDLQNLKQPQLVYDVHKAYIDAGADIIETNTFGANRIKLEEASSKGQGSRVKGQVEKVNQAAVRLAKKAAGEKAFVLGSVGPIGKLLEPMGTLSFDEAHDVFKEQIEALVSAGVDGLILETISDLQEMRAALIAAREVTDKPIVTSMTYDETGKTITGTPPEVAALVLESLGASIISANCSMGPASLLKIAQRLISASNLPVMVMPNAGNPDLINGQAVYKMTPDQFAAFAQKFVKLGVRIFGGCCGTTPEHIAAVSERIKNSKLEIRNSKLEIRDSRLDVFASRTKVFEIDGFLKIGERINPTGRKVLAQQIKEGQTILIRQDAVNQTKSGASILDVNVSVPDVDGKKAIKKAIHTIEVASNLSLSIDSPDPEVIEAGLKAFPGRVLINSVNGEEESLKKVLPLVKKYGASVIALCLDKKGIPETAQGKLKIAQKIVKAAEKLGISKNRIWVDALVMTAGIGIEKPLETLEAMSLIKKKIKVKTSLGISNCSHGLPGRSQINALYLELAILKGLDGAIIDVTDEKIRKALRLRSGHRLASGTERSRGGRDYKKILEKFKKECTKWKEAKAKGFKTKARSEEDLKLLDKATHIKGGLPAIKQAIIDGDAESIVILVKQALENNDPQKLIDEALVPPMEQVGKWFSAGKYFLPQVMASAEAMSKGFELCKAKIPAGSIKNKGLILIATVKGDIHDIGKNIVRMMLENNGFKVLDMGKDVEAEEILKIALKEKPKAIALSALLTTTMVQMEEVKAKLLEAGLDIPIIVGGAVVTPEYAKRIGAFYGADAAQAVEQAKQILKSL